MSGNVVSFLKRHLFTCHSSSLFHSRKDAVPCDVILYFTRAALLPHSIMTHQIQPGALSKSFSHTSLCHLLLYLPCPPYRNVFPCVHLPSRETRQTNAGVLQLWQSAYPAASFLPFLLQRVSNPISSSLAPQRQPFSQSMATACCQSELPSRATPAFCHSAPLCQLQWEMLSLH